MWERGRTRVNSVVLKKRVDSEKASRAWWARVGNIDCIAMTAAPDPATFEFRLSFDRTLHSASRHLSQWRAKSLVDHPTIIVVATQAGSRANGLNLEVRIAMRNVCASLESLARI